MKQILGISRTFMAMIFRTPAFLSLALAVLSASLFSPVSAQAEPQEEALLKLNMFDFVHGRYELLYEKVLDHETTFQMAINGIGWVENARGGQYYYDDETFTDYYFDSEAVLEHSGWGITPEIRRYAWVNGGVPEGVFLSLFARYEVHAISVDEEAIDISDWPESFSIYDGEVDFSAKRTQMGAGLLVGFQWVADNGISLEVFMGPEFRSLNMRWDFDSEMSDLEVEAAQDAFRDRILDRSSFRTQNLFNARTGPYVRFGITAGLGL